jgi:hypothetical protein
MFPIKSNAGLVVLTALFCDPFDMAHAIAALIRDGFSEYEIDAIGVLCGRAPDLTDSLFSMGIERDKAIFYNDCFADGAMLLIVRAETGRRARFVLNMLRRHGGVVPAAKNQANTRNAALSAAEKEVVS